MSHVFFAELNFASTQSKWYSLQHILCTLIWGQKRSKNINKTVPNDGTWCTSDTCFMSVVALRLYGGLIWILVMCAAKNMGEPDSLFGPMSVIFQQPWGSRYDPIWHAEKLTHQFLSTYIFVSGEAVVEWIPLQFHVIVVSKKQEIHLQDMPRNTSVLPGSPDVAGVDHQIFRMERVQWLLFTRTLWRNTAHDDDAHEESLISTLFSPHNCLTGQIIQPVCVNSFQTIFNPYRIW